MPFNMTLKELGEFAFCLVFFILIFGPTLGIGFVNFIRSTGGKNNWLPMDWSNLLFGLLVGSTGLIKDDWFLVIMGFAILQAIPTRILQRKIALLEGLLRQTPGNHEKLPPEVASISKTSSWLKGK